MDPKLKALVDAPLANPLAINLPEGRRPAPRDNSPARQHRPGDLTPDQLRAKRANEANAKLATLYDYYAGTEVPPERVAEHLGVYRTEEDGTDDKGQVKYKRVLDVEKVRSELAWRRQQLRG